MATFLGQVSFRELFKQNDTTEQNAFWQFPKGSTNTISSFRGFSPSLSSAGGVLAAFLGSAGATFASISQTLDHKGSGTFELLMWSN